MIATRSYFVCLFFIIFGTALPVTAETPEPFQSVAPILKKYCTQCHGPGEKKGGIRFDQLDPDLVNGDDAARWNDVLDQINLGEMPPEDAPQPTLQERRQLSRWLVSALREAAAAKRFKDGRVHSRRLTRYEYSNTMRDLLKTNLNFARDLPPEPASREGFQNDGSVLEMSPTQIEMYLSIARKALQEVIVIGEQPELYEFAQHETAQGKLPEKKVAGHEPVRPEFILDIPQFPRHGEFEFTVTARASVPDGQGLPRIVITLGHVPGIIHVPRGLVGSADVSEQQRTFTFRGRLEDFPQPGPIAFGSSGFKGLIAMVDFTDADGQELRYPDRKYAQKPTPPKKKRNSKEQDVEEDERKTVPFGGRLDIEILSAEFKAPVYSSWPPPGHREFLFESADTDEAQYARAVLKQFMSKAFRRPVNDQEVDEVTELFHALRDRSNSFEEAMRESFAAVLVSPHFLYIVEKRNGSEFERITDYELASRLSYFLWSTSPDQELMSLAHRGQLSDENVLEAQTLRLLSDARSDEFVTHFVDQWLDLDALNRVAVNPEYYPDFDNSLKELMRQQTHAYFAEILRKNQSALNLIDADWEMLNRQLASHYGIEGPRSSQFERISLTSDDRRGGLLTQGSYLLANSNGEDSHPIKRAVWILDRLLDSPPAPPPPEVPQLDPTRPDLAQLTLKQQLAVHREKESCHSCHQGIDPWGIPLENFDAVGRWRSEVAALNNRPATPVDSSSILPSGQKISGIEELRHHLLTQKNKLFARALVKRLMAYSLGRSVDFGDRQAVETLTTRFIEEDYRIQSLIVDLVQSETFLTK